MPISGPITPTYYGLPYAAAPNATLGNLFYSGADEGTIFTCTKTGRMWVLGRTNDAPGAPNPTVRQMLPYTRNDAGTAAVQVTNSNGDMVFSVPAGVATSKVSFNTSLNVTTSDVTMGGVPHYPYSQAPLQNGSGTLRARYGTGLVMAVFPELSAIANDVTITNANTAQQIVTLGFTNPSQETYVRFRVEGVAYHNNNYDLSVAIVRWRAGNAKSEPLAATTVSGPQNGGYVRFACEVDRALLVTDENGVDTLRVFFAASVGGVVIKATPVFTFADTRSPAVPPATTYRIAEVLA